MSVALVAVDIVAPAVNVTVAVPLLAAESGDADTVAASAVPVSSGKPATVRTAAAPATTAARRHVLRIIGLPQAGQNSSTSSSVR
jgi:hypothetical protein